MTDSATRARPSSSETFGLPNRRTISSVLANSAVSPGVPVNCGSLPISRPSFSAMAWTATFSVPVRLRYFAGTEATS